MAPEILRYEKYDAKADLWSVGAVLYEMAAGKPPFRANNHVELLRKIEKSEDRIKFPDESRHSEGGDDKEQSSVVPVSPDIKALIRRLLRRRPTERMGFEEFFACGVWDGHMTESSDGSLSLDVSTDSSAVLGSRLREMVESAEKARDKERLVPTHAPQPLATDPALNPQPAPRPSSAVTTRNAATVMISPQAVQAARPLVRRSEPKYYVSDNSPAPETPSTIPSTSTATPAPSSTQTQIQTPRPAPSIPSRTGPQPQPISNVDRRLSAPSSVEDPAPITPNAGTVGTPPAKSERGLAPGCDATHHVGCDCGGNGQECECARTRAIQSWAGSMSWWRSRMSRSTLLRMVCPFMTGCQVPSGRVAEWPSAKCRLHR